MNKNLGLAMVVVTIIAVAGFFYPKTEVKMGAVGLQGPAGNDGKSIVGPQGPAGRDGASGKTLGSVSGPNTYLPFVANNNLQKYGQTVTLRVATTTVCAIKSPTATSSLTFSGVNLLRSSTTASVVTLAKATTPYATTTFLGSLSLAANAQGTVVATTSLPVGSAVFAPNTWFVVGMSGGIGTFSPAGSCSAEFTRI